MINNFIGKIDLKDLKNSDFTESEKRIHHTLISLRDKFYAHNDPENNSLLIYYDEALGKLMTTSSVSFHSLADHKEPIFSLLHNVKKALEEKRNELLAQCYSENGPWQVNMNKSYILTYYTGMVENPINRS